MKIKTSELTGAALDWAVAKCEGCNVKRLNNIPMWLHIRQQGAFRFHSDWAQGGPLLERQEIGIRVNRPCSTGREWEASPSITAKGAGGQWGYGPTPLIAAIRCFISSTLGDEVEIPDELG